MTPPTPARTLPKPHRTAVALALVIALGLPAWAVATERFDIGAWSAAIPTEPTEPCELTTGGYDHAADAQDPLLLITLPREEPVAPLRVNVITVTELTQPELLKARAALSVDGPGARTVALIPAAIVETNMERRVTFRPLPGGGAGANLRTLVDAMRRAGQVRVEINGLPLEPAFSMRGLDAIWQRAAAACGPRP